jgi:hypothetical protein
MRSASEDFLATAFVSLYFKTLRVASCAPTVKNLRLRMRLRIDPNFRSRVEMMRKARLDGIMGEAVAASAAALAETAHNITEDLIAQHTLVSPEQAAELKAHFELELER